MTYRELESVEIPQDVPELDVVAGDSGVISYVYEDGKMLDVEISKPGGTSAGFVDLRVKDDGSTEVVGHSRLSSY